MSKFAEFIGHCVLFLAAIYGLTRIAEMNRSRDVAKTEERDRDLRGQIADVFRRGAQP
jgi:hypothetical protein